ncbi:MAG: AAA family ATPase [Rhodospirillales bacterium]|nr:AAA family ATPase [Rhodospirillales bacterium]
MIIRISIGAFLLSPESQGAITALREDRLFFRSTINTYEGGIDAAVSHLANETTPTLVIVETTAGRDRMFEQLEALANVCDPETRLLLIGAENDIELFRTLISDGVSDYLIGPVTADQIKTSVGKIFQNGSGENGRVIAFAGMTGGVGSSVIAHNVAHELSALYDEQVIVVDLDIPYGTAALNYNVQPRQTIVEALTNSASLDPTMVNQYLMECGDSKLSALASPASLGTGVEITSGPLDAVLRVIKPMAGYVVLDIPHLWGGWINDVMALADDLIFICRPDLANLRNAKNMVEYIGPKRGVEAPTRLVLNQVGAAKRADLTSKDFKDSLALDPVVSIPYDPEAFGAALNNGEMLSKVSAKSKATLAIGDLTKIVSARELVEEESGGSILSKLKQAMTKNKVKA